MKIPHFPSWAILRPWHKAVLGLVVLLAAFTISFSLTRSLSRGPGSEPGDLVSRPPAEASLPRVEEWNEPSLAGALPPAGTLPGPGAEPRAPSVSAVGEKGTEAPRGGPVPGERGVSTVPQKGEDVEKPFLPLEGEIIRGFGLNYSRTHEDWRYHAGIDIGAAEGSPFHAVVSGTVGSIEYTRERGYTIILDHPGGVRTVYSNAASVDVSAGSKVKRGQRLGTVGHGGLQEVSDGSHLHLEILVDGKAIDPNEYLTR